MGKHKGGNRRRELFDQLLAGCQLNPRVTCSHRGEPVRVGPYEILAGASWDLKPEDLDKADLIIPLDSKLPMRIGQKVTLLACSWEDRKAPPAGFETFLLESVIPALEAGKKILGYCTGGHGRTGTFLAALIVLLEPQITDPIAEVRKRHCSQAIETSAQEQYIRELQSRVRAAKPEGSR